ncbi:hypothetical protein COJ96_10765 [Bacillus sp. AFS073361]|uniref:DUF421 domain-containing protein n=1 Tax=Bacillus sp. AFS073361 TaxID=2033511 RepID=UPI000BF87760|nr:YetF domain-containing protein [Bacillus sp. AFS073361]PFP29378.1 hypothetical protein COJ96_10765 [Bacillus sp. AFS073361]
MEPFLNLCLKLPFGILFMFLHMRIMGLKELSQSNALDFGFAVLVANISWDLSVTPDYQIWHMIVVNIILGIIYFLLDWVTANNRKWEKRILGEPQIVVKNGVINRELLEKERLSEAELRARLRCSGVFDIRLVEIAYLEVSGQISVLKRGENNVFDKGAEAQNREN